MKTKNDATENEQRLNNLEMKIKDYQTDFKILGIEKDILNNRIINLKNKIENLESFNE